MLRDCCGVGLCWGPDGRWKVCKHLFPHSATAQGNISTMVTTKMHPGVFPLVLQVDYASPTTQLDFAGDCVICGSDLHEALLRY